MSSPTGEAAVIQTYLEAVHTECAEITALSHELLKQVSGLFKTADFIKYEVSAVSEPSSSGRLLLLDRATPLPWQKVLMRAYGDLANGAPILPSYGQHLGGHFLSSAGVALEEPVTQTHYSPKAAPDICQLGESRFGRIISQLQKPDESKIQRGELSHDRINVYHDENYVPLIIEKDRDVTSALTLVTFSVGGIRTAPFTIVGMDRNTSHRLTGTATSADGALLQTYRLAPNAGMAPGRLSAWAGNPERRIFFGISYNSGYPDLNPTYANSATAYTASDFTNTANQIVRLCSA